MIHSLLFALAMSSWSHEYVAKQAPVINAISKTDVTKLKQLLAAKADPNCREILTEVPNATEGNKGGKTSAGMTALDLAVHNRSESMVAMLLKAKANPNMRSPYGYTPAMTACQRSLLPVLKLLIHAGANPNIVNENGDSAATFAANNDFADGLRVLKSAGANFKGKIGRDALSMAITSSAEKSVRYLISAGVDVNGHEPGEMNALESSLMGSYTPTEIIKLIKKAGGKARPMAVLKTESDARYAKYKKELESKPNPRIPKDATASVATIEDIAVIQAGLDTLANDKDFMVGYREEKLSKIALVSEIGGPVDEYMESQMNGELSERQATEIDFDMRGDFLRRNGKANSPVKSPFSDSRIVMVKASDVYVGISGFDFLKNIGAKAWVSVHIPGFSADGMKAFIRFNFGPTSHGASGTMLLKKVSGKWTVVWTDHAFYA